MKVRAGSWYVYSPVALDVYDARTALKPGDRVQVRNLNGAPKANTMGHAHVFDANGKFAGLVCTASLSKPAAGEVA
jgi:hypothetical protein